jgi:hypothetical protein
MQIRFTRHDRRQAETNRLGESATDARSLREVFKASQSNLGRDSFTALVPPPARGLPIGRVINKQIYL